MAPSESPPKPCALGCRGAEVNHPVEQFVDPALNVTSPPGNPASVEGKPLHGGYLLRRTLAENDWLRIIWLAKPVGQLAPAWMISAPYTMLTSAEFDHGLLGRITVLTPDAVLPITK